jgi:hypothetical protein
MRNTVTATAGSKYLVEDKKINSVFIRNKYG